MSDVLKVNNVSVVRDQASILSDVSWHVNEGEHWVILGPNGAGKTTLVSLISGWSLPTTGTVEIIGETTTDTDLRELKSMVGVASAGIDARISGREKFSTSFARPPMDVAQRGLKTTTPKIVIAPVAC